MGQMPSTLHCEAGNPMPTTSDWGAAFVGPVSQEADVYWFAYCDQTIVGADISSTSPANSWYDCATACDNSISCMGLSYDGTQCNQYANLTGATQTSSTGINIITISGTRTVAATCVEGTYDGYDVLCDQIYTGGDLSSQAADDFDDCVSACDSANGCVGVSYVGGQCNLKSQLLTLSPQSGVWTARKPSAVQSSSTTSSSTTSATTSQTSTQQSSQLSTSTTSTSSSATTTTTQPTTISTTTTTTTLAPTTTTTTITTTPSTTTTTTTTSQPSTSTPAQPLSCVSNASNGTTYHGFTIQCSTDFYGGDMGSLSTPTFEQCIDKCATTTGCIIVAYNGNMCYMKNVMNAPQNNPNVWGATLSPVSSSTTTTTTSTTPVAISSTTTTTTTKPPSTTSTPTNGVIPTTTTTTTTITPSTTTTISITTTTTTTTTPPTTTTTTITSTSTTTTTTTTSFQASITNVNNGCIPGTFNSGSAIYYIFCDSTFFGGDMSSQQVNSFSACIAACDANQGCVDVSYVGNMCYLKSTLTTLKDEKGTQTAVLKTIADAASVANVASPGGLSCTNNASNGKTYVAASGATFQIVCGTDYMGGDMGTVTGVTFQQCIDSCDASVGCIDVAYRGTNCYLKNKLQPGDQDSGVSGAKIVIPAAPGSSTISSTH